MEKQSRLETALTREKEASLSVVDFLGGLQDRYRKAKQEKRELKTVDDVFYNDLRDVLLYSTMYFRSRPQIEFGSGQAAEEFYNILISKLNRDVYKHLRNNDVKRLSGKMESKISDLYNEIYDIVLSLRKTYGNYANFHTAIPLSLLQLTGLTTSYLLNNSEKANKIRFIDGEAITTEYLGAFTKNGKSVIVNGSAGKNFGYKHEDDAMLFVYDKKVASVSRLRIGLQSLSDSFKYHSKWFVASLGAMYSSIIGISWLQDQNLLPFIQMPTEICTLSNKCTIGTQNLSLLGLVTKHIGGPFGDLTLSTFVDGAVFGVFAAKVLYDFSKRYADERYRLLSAATEEKNLKACWGAFQKAAAAYVKDKTMASQVKKDSGHTTD